MRKNAIRFMLNDYPDVMSIDEMCRALSIGQKDWIQAITDWPDSFLENRPRISHSENQFVGISASNPTGMKRAFLI